MKFLGFGVCVARLKFSISLEMFNLRAACPQNETAPEKTFTEKLLN